MRAFVVDKYKEPLREADVPEPIVGAHDVLVRVEAAGLNPLDEKIRAGEFKQVLPYKLPLIPGNDVAGRERRHDRQRVERGLRARTRRGHGDRLPHPGLRAAPGRLRPGARQPRWGEPRKVPAGAEARRQGHRDRRPPGPRIRPRGGLNPLLRLVIAGLSGKVRKQAKKLGVTYEFLFMRASGDQLRQITALVDQGVLRPVVGRVFGFDQTPQALQSLSQGGIRGKAVITANS